MPAEPRPPSPSTRAWALAAAVAALALYAPTLGHGFVFDDDIVIVKNRLIRSLAALPELVSRTEWAGGGVPGNPLYRPLTGVTYAANHAISGLAPWSYHAVNVVLHALVAALVLALGLRLRLGAGASGVAALLFAVHPVHVEAVSNVVGRKDVLATLLLLAMLVLHERARAGTAAQRALAIAAYAGAMLSKEVGVVGIALAAALDLAAPPPAGAPWRAALRRSAPLYAGYALALVLYLLAYRSVMSAIAPTGISFEDNPTVLATPAVRVMTAVAVLGKGVALQALPLRQSPDYSYAAIPLVTSPLDLRFLAAAALFAAWGAAAVVLRRRAPIVAWSLAFYGAALLPASNLLFPVGTIFGERLLYLPSVALALLAGAGVSWAAERVPSRAVTRAAIGALLLACSLATVRYSAAWADEERLFRTALRNQPASTKVHHKLALLVGKRDPQEALGHIRRALEIAPRNVDALLAHALILRKLGRSAEERDALRQAVALAPGNAEACYGMGRLAREAGRLDEAAAWWRSALATNPAHAPTLADLATFELLRGDAAAALDLASRSVAADPDLASAWYALALLHRARGDAARSRAAFERFVAVAGAEYAGEAAQVRAMLARGEPR